MSTGRRTAFARTPRNPGANSSKDKEENKIIRINKQFLDRMTQSKLEAETSTVLTKTESELALAIGANGKGNYHITRRDGRILGDSADVMKVQTLGTFINEERKALLKSSVSGSTQKSLAAIVQRCQDSGGGLTRFPRHFLDAFRALSSQMDTLAANVTAITALDASPGINQEVKDHLLETATRIRAVVGDYIVYRALLSDDDVPEKVNSRLLQSGILVWTFVRLTSQKMQLGGKDFEFRRVYFPKDPTKGLQITFREWNTPEVRDGQSTILSGCSYTCSLWNWANSRQFLGFEQSNPDFDDVHKALANVPLLVVPPSGGWTAQEVLSALGKSGDRGLAWSVGMTTKPQDTLKFLGTVPRRVALGAISRPALKVDLIQSMYPGFDPTAEGEGVYARLYKQSKTAGFDDTWTTHICSRRTDRNTVMQRIATDVLGLSEGTLFRLARDSCRVSLSPTEGRGIGATDTWAEIMATKVAITDERASELLATKVDPSWFTKKRKQKEIDFRSARSQLSEGGATLIAALKARRYKALADRVEAWLRTFLTTDLQSAVAEVILAKLDASLSRPVEFGREDRIAVLQPVDEEASDSEDDPDEGVGGDTNPDEE